MTRSPTARRAAVSGLGAAAVVAIAIVLGAGGPAHRVTVTVPQATGVVEGFKVRAAGRTVGSVQEAKVTDDYRARLVIGLDDSVWPLPRDSKLEVRLGGTVKFSDRYIALTRGSDSSPAIPEGGAFPADRFVVPVEFDEVFKTFDARTRQDLRRFTDNAGRSFDRARDELRTTIRVAPPAVQQAQRIFRDLGADPEALRALLVSTDRVVAAVRRADPGIGPLVDDATTSFEAVAAESRGLRSALTEIPSTLRTTRRTLSHASRTLTSATRLSTRLSPGIGAARELATPLTAVLRTLTAIGPDARRTLATARRAAPDATRLLRQARSMLPALRSAARQADTQLACIRPYAPEVAGLASNWGAGFFSRGDKKDKYLRSAVGPTPYTNVSTFDTAALAKLFPGVGVAFPRPPGQLVDQPWFQPQCNIGPEALDPAKDPESSQRFDPLAKPELVRLKPPSQGSTRSSR